MSESDMLSKIFEMVESKRQEKKPPRKKREMTPEARERMLANLKKGRETSLAKRRAKKGEKAAPTKAPTPPPKAPTPPPTEAPSPTPSSTAPMDVPSPPSTIPPSTPAPSSSTSTPLTSKPSQKVAINPIKEDAVDTTPLTVPPSLTATPPIDIPKPRPRAATPEPFTYSTYGGGGSFW